MAFGIFCGGILVYQWGDRKQKLERLQAGLNELERLKDQVQRQYQLQDINFTSSPEKSNDYAYIDISFDKMIKTCSHELAHYIQLVKHGRSSCESDLKLENGKYDEELAKEHEEFAQEIYGMINNSDEYSEGEKRGKEI